MRVSACDSRIAMPLCPQAKKLEAAGKAPPIRRHVDGASVPRVAYVLLLLVNLCHSMHRVPKTCCLHHKSPSKVSGHPEHLLHVSPAQNCEDRKARFRKQRLGANLEKNMSDRLLSLLEISAPLDGSWHGLSSKCLYTAGLRTKDWSSFAELVSDGFLEGRA